MSECCCYTDSIRDIQFKAAIHFIEKTFRVKTNRANPCTSCRINDRLTSATLRELGEEEETLEVTENEYLKIHLSPSEGLIGYYDVDNARIFLINGKWCISHIIHETLHSRCVFCTKNVTPKGLILDIEGLNELLTGAILRAIAPRCYDWWCLKNKCFGEIYSEYLKTWHYLTFKMPFTSLISLYFDTQNKQPFLDLEMILENELGYSFKNIFSPKQTYQAFFAHDRFVDSLKKIFPDFGAYYKTPLTKIDLEQLRI
jgi:hypothetical protein